MTKSPETLVKSLQHFVYTEGVRSSSLLPSKAFGFVKSSGIPTCYPELWRRRKALLRVRFRRPSCNTLICASTSEIHEVLGTISGEGNPRDQLCGGRRVTPTQARLFDIAHDYPIIGMNHSEVIAVLGTADHIPNVPKDAHSKFDYVDKYVLSQGCVGIYSVLEIAYSLLNPKQSSAI